MMQDAMNLEDSADVLRVLGHTVRLNLLSAIIDGERAVSEIEALTGITQPMLSQQLGVLRKSQLVETRREAKQIFYRINHDRMQAVRALMDRLAGTGRDSSAAMAMDRFQSGGSAAMFARIG
ncbi:metalloregulator ArsR/SmtB family transcription factor [Altererythrobacter indicus]|uniref:Metalloregulator ArsR/SmtB family transcription factor n=1 Tax=Altericroceibacterium indicum TaxID=374177 RepID=A0A845ADJ8_9SPHN|nr:metalloregulator ArsR/SmtB family transcription factor [Altericroceibacterium indicum]MXP27051.1 metalloregulator ArsR/SmtB family transcription factor [Altericroceibacterium indicum]